MASAEPRERARRTNNAAVERKRRDWGRGGDEVLLRGGGEGGATECSEGVGGGPVL